MIENIYFIIQQNTAMKEDILSICIEKNIDAMRKSNDGRMIFKLPAGAKIPDILNSTPSFSHDEIIKELQKKEWTE